MVDGFINETKATTFKILMLAASAIVCIEYQLASLTQNSG